MTSSISACVLNTFDTTHKMLIVTIMYVYHFNISAWRCKIPLQHSGGIQALSARPTGFLQCFDTVGLVIWTIKPVPDMTYNVFGKTLNLAQSMQHSCSNNQHFTFLLIFCKRENLSQKWKKILCLQHVKMAVASNVLPVFSGHLPCTTVLLIVSLGKIALSCCQPQPASLLSTGWEAISRDEN